MAAGAKDGALRNGNVAADDDAFQVQQPAFLAEPDVVADLEFPRKGDFDLRLDGHVSPDVGPECAQCRAFQRRKTERAEAEQNQADDEPEAFLDHPGSTVKLSRSVAGQVHGQRRAVAGLGLRFTHVARMISGSRWNLQASSTQSGFAPPPKIHSWTDCNCRATRGQVKRSTTSSCPRFPIAIRSAPVM